MSTFAVVAAGWAATSFVFGIVVGAIIRRADDATPEPPQQVEEPVYVPSEWVA